MGEFYTKNNNQENEENENDYLKFISNNIQNWKKQNENTFISKISQGVENNYDIFCIFDGHNGNEVSKFVKNHFCSEFLDNASKYKIETAINNTFSRMNKLMQSEEGKKEIIQLKISNQEEENKKYKKVLNQNIDEKQIKKFKEELSKEEQDEILEYTGCTAISIIIDEKKKKLYFANIGNSIAIVFGKDYSQIFESQHRPTDISEKNRIEKPNEVIFNDKLYGVLNATRTFGDFAYIHNNNQKIIIDQPDFKEYDIKDNDEFIFIATESIIELFDKDKIGDTLKDLVKPNNSFDSLKEKITEIIKGNIVNDFYNNDTEFGFDNMTYTLIQIKTQNK